MTDLFLSPSNFWFSIALSAVCLVLLMELAGMLFGVSLIGIGDDTKPKVRGGKKEVCHLHRP